MTNSINVKYNFIYFFFLKYTKTIIGMLFLKKKFYINLFMGNYVIDHYSLHHILIWSSAFDCVNLDSNILMLCQFNSYCYFLVENC